MNRSAGCGAPVASSHHPILPGSSCHDHPMWDLWFIRHSSKKNQDALGNNLDSAFLAGRAHLCYIQISHDLPQVQQQRLSLGPEFLETGAAVRGTAARTRLARASPVRPNTEGAVDPLLNQSNGPQAGAAHQTGVSDRQRQLRAAGPFPPALGAVLSVVAEVTPLAECRPPRLSSPQASGRLSYTWAAVRTTTAPVSSRRL